MTIARQLHQYRAQFIVIFASNVLDQIFLAQFLHRAGPEARLVFLGADLLMVREVDNVPFIGTVTITPYSLIGLRSSRRAHPDSMSEAYYNAVSYTLWRNYLYKDTQPRFQGYRNLLDPTDIYHPSVWATAIGRDGYYPLAIMSGSSRSTHDRAPIPEDSREALKKVLAQAAVYPSLLWAVVCVSVLCLCLLHTMMLFIADYWSPFSRDLAVRDNDQPWRRSS
jgi:hypothetical protein